VFQGAEVGSTAVAARQLPLLEIDVIGLLSGSALLAHRLILQADSDAAVKARHVGVGVTVVALVQTTFKL
jgi:hypothetical protein